MTRLTSIYGRLPQLIKAGELVLLALIVIGWAATDKVSAKSLSTGHLTFSDELGGFELVSVSGVGTKVDPIIVVERMRTLDPTLLVIRRSRRKKAPGQTMLRDPIRVVVVKIVINATGRVWGGYDLELQEQRGKPSVYRDGLSFDQLSSFRDVELESDRFEKSTWKAEPYDRIRFRQGSVDPNFAVRLNFAITDITPVPEFYLLQQPLFLTVQAYPNLQAELRR
ncbi:MAG: hypothetical protein V3V97_04265 [Hyphomicrobiaceae bacterium]